MINGQVENVKPMSKQELNKYDRKIVDLSKVFYVPEYPKHISNGNGFNPPRCNKCQTISYNFSQVDTSDNHCQECIDNDEVIQEIKVDSQFQFDRLQSSFDEIECTLANLGDLKHKYFWKTTSDTDKVKILDKIFDLID
jgi:hypothetical protein